jgi:type II secretory pathway component PulF
MPLYQYTAIDDLGQRITGQVEASNEAALGTMLSRQGQWLAEASERQISVRRAARTRGNRRVPRRVLIEFFLQLHLQLRAGVSLIDALHFGLDDGANPGFRPIQRDLRERIRAGAAFSEAMAAHPRTFPPLVANLIRAGEGSGRLAESCREIQRYYEWLDRLIGDFRQALIYPLIVLGVTVIFFFVVFTTLIPRFATMLTELKIKLPWLTLAMLDLSRVMTQYAWGIGLGLAGLVAVLKFGPRSWSWFALLLDRLKLRLPIFGRILHLVCLARLAQNLTTLYSAGIPLLEALKLCRPLVGNRVVEAGVATLQAGVNAGRQLHEVMREDPIFSRLMIQMVAVGESSGTLGDSLQHVADYYNDVVPRQVKKLLTILEPVMILGLIVVVGTVALSVFLPIAETLGAQ